MKKLILITAVIICLCFTAIYDTKKSTGEVEQFEGLYVFTDSKPVTQYDYLGTVKATFTMNGEYKEVRDKLIKKAKKEYPTAEAIILHFTSGGIDKCDAVKFK